MTQKKEVLVGIWGGLLGTFSLGCSVDAVEHSERDQTIALEAAEDLVQIVSRHGGKCLDVSGAGSQNGTNIQLWTCNGTAAQHFQVEKLSSGRVRFVNVASGKCVDVAGASTENGANIQLWDCNGTSAQSFSGSDAGGGYYSFTNTKSGRAIDVAGWGTSNGSNIQQWDYSWGDNQMWRLEAAPSGLPPTTSPVTLRVMSLNVYGHATMPGAASIYANLIKSQAIDVVGIQEGVNDWQLNTAFPTDYSRAEALGAALGSCYQRRNQVFVNVCRGNSILGNDRFDLTDGPNVTRTGEAVTVTKDGKSFGFIDVHWDHQSSSTKVANAQETAARAQGFSNVPVIIVGDFNTSCSGSTAGVMKTAASLDLIFNGGIDCIFSKRATKSKGYTVNASPSDHPSVVAELTL